MISSTPQYSRIYINGTMTCIDARNDPRETNIQKQWTSFTIEIRTKYQRKDGEVIEKTQVVPCVCFGKLAAQLEQVEMILPLRVVAEGIFSTRPTDGRVEVLVGKLYSEEVVDPSGFDAFDE